MSVSAILWVLAAIIGMFTVSIGWLALQAWLYEREDNAFLSTRPKPFVLVCLMRRETICMHTLARCRHHQPVNANLPNGKRPMLLLTGPAQPPAQPTRSFTLIHGGRQAVEDTYRQA